MAGTTVAQTVLGDDCSREPIHVIGHIQAHGLLVALCETDFTVQQISANVETLLGLPLGAVLGASFEVIVGAAQFAIFQAHVRTDDLCTAYPLRMFVGEAGIEMNCVTHRHDGTLIAELEILAGAHSLEPVNVAADIQVPLARMDAASDIVDLSAVAAREVRRLSGFDRVMVYRFDADWNGEVIAEQSAPSAISYLGLRFPSSDIPAQARRLFLVNALRAITDVHSAPVPIVPEFAPRTGKALDLTRSFLRSASPVHIEYLRNLRVASTVTVSIVVNGRLWGMIACHHNSPRRIDCSMRAVCELIGRMFASQIALRIDNAALNARLTSRALLENYMAGVEASTTLFDARPFESVRLLELFDADGLISRVGNVVFTNGITVSEPTLMPLIRKMRKFASRGIASSNMLSALDVSAEAFAPSVSGALYLGFSENSDDYLLLLRRELVETVNWAGNPDKAVNASPDGSLRPRTSFAAWRETLRFRSRTWTELELESARFLREQLLRLREARRTTAG